MIEASKRSRRARQKGYTVVEILVTLGLTVSILFFAGWMIISVFNMENRIRENISTQTDLNSVFYRLRSLASRGINVRYSPSSLNNVSSVGDEGYVRSFSYEKYDDETVHENVVLMYFNVETGRSRIDVNLASEPEPVAVFFRKPTGDASGAILIATRNTSGELSPDMARLRYDGVIGVILKDAQASAKGVLERITLELTVRYFIGSASSGKKVWCPPAETSAECRVGVPYRDITREIVLSFENNLREVRFPSFAFGSGSYFFAPVIER